MMASTEGPKHVGVIISNKLSRINLCISLVLFFVFTIENARSKKQNSWQIFGKYSNVEIHKNPSPVGGRVVPWRLKDGWKDGQTDITKLTVFFYFFLSILWTRLKLCFTYFEGDSYFDGNYKQFLVSSKEKSFYGSRNRAELLRQLAINRTNLILVTVFEI